MRDEEVGINEGINEGINGDSLTWNNQTNEYHSKNLCRYEYKNMQHHQTIWYISIYPPKWSLHGSGASGVWSYTKNLITHLPKEIQDDVVVFCDYDNTHPKDEYQEWNIYIDRCRTRKWIIWFVSQIISNLKKYPNLKQIHIQHEFNMFGSIWTIPFVWFLLLFIKIKWIKNIITFHWLSSPDIIDKQYCEINLLPWYLPAWVIRFCFLIFYGVAKYMLDKVIVHEDYFVHILLKKYWYKKENISMIHHGIEKINSTMNKSEARAKLWIPEDKKVLLYFGFLAGYKWVWLLLDGFEKMDDSYHLILAWWVPKRTAKDPKFMDRYNKLESRISWISNITRIWFVPDEDIQTIYMASDLLVIPYIYMLAASWPMSLSIAYWLPFVISEPFEPVISHKDIIFELNGHSLAEHIEDNIWSDKNNSYIKDLQQTRSRAKIAKETSKLYI
jgi:glycosyltransferase involved in cell wall biosynthesis